MTTEGTAVTVAQGSCNVYVSPSQQPKRCGIACPYATPFLLHVLLCFEPQHLIAILERGSCLLPQAGCTLSLQ